MKITISILSIICLCRLISYSQECTYPDASHMMNVNNVRTTLRNDGALFSDKSYFFPNEGNDETAVSTIFQAGLWFSYLDIFGVLKGNQPIGPNGGHHYIAGPLTNGSIDSLTCKRWNKFFTVKSSSIIDHIRAYKLAKKQGQPMNCEAIPLEVLSWPAKGNPYFKKINGWHLPEQELADFWDMDQNGLYDPCKGDYPSTSNRCQMGYHEGTAIPAEINFYVINDLYAFNEESSSIELQVHAFAYSGDTELNDMTFYQYKLTNKSPFPFFQSYLSMWLDPDIGCYQDDYVGCDPMSGLGFVYNQDTIDGSAQNSCPKTNTYPKDKIPTTGYAFLNPPKVNKEFVRDTMGNILLDSNNNKILTNPKNFESDGDTSICQVLSSFYVPKTTDEYRPRSTVEARKNLFDFPGDPSNHLDTLSQCARMPSLLDWKSIMSIGPLNISSNESTQFSFVIMAVKNEEYPCPSTVKLKNSLAIAKQVIENCDQSAFIMGPDAPILSAKETNKKIILNINNDEFSNNDQESYEEIIKSLPNTVDNTYNFEGYRIFQLANAKVRYDQLSDTNYSRQIFQSDIENEITDAFIYNQTSGSNWQKSLKVNGENKGIKYEYEFEKDAFTGKIVENKKEYHFAIVAYGYNNGIPFDTLTGQGQARQYISSSNNWRQYTFSPSYGQQDDNFEVTRISGEGNPNVFLQVDKKLYSDIFTPNYDGKITYQKGFAPISIKVLDKSKLRVGNQYKVEVDGNYNQYSNSSIIFSCSYYDDATWKITDLTTNTTLAEDIKFYDDTDVILNDHGITISLDNYQEPGLNLYQQNGGIGATIEYKDQNGLIWFNTVKQNGEYKLPSGVNDSTKALNFHRFDEEDPEHKLSHLGNRSFVPFGSTKYGIDRDIFFYLSPAAQDNISAILKAFNIIRPRNLNNVDIVMTSDKSKWSKCVVVETTIDGYTSAGLASIGNARNFELRQSPSIDQNGQLLNDNTIGFSYFPGFAVDVETGERLNIFFGENSSLNTQNAANYGFKMDNNEFVTTDLIFNPTSQKGFKNDDYFVMGGQHYIYVTRQKYDGCAIIAEKLKKGTNTFIKSKGAGSITWTAFPFLEQGQKMLPLEDGLIPNDLIIKLRVDNSYSPTKYYDINKEKECSVLADHPVYQFTVFEPTSTEDNDPIKPSYFAQPNPIMISNGQKTLTIQNLPDNTQVSFTNVMGMNIFQTNSKLGRIDLSEAKLAPGMYIVTVLDKGKHIASLKLMVL